MYDGACICVNASANNEFSLIFFDFKGKRGAMHKRGNMEETDSKNGKINCQV
jgi:hypothetical protein